MCMPYHFLQLTDFRIIDQLYADLEQANDKNDNEGKDFIEKRNRYAMVRIVL